VANAWVLRRRDLDEAYRAACDAGVVFSDAPASLGPDTPDGAASASTQPLSPRQIRAARHLAQASAAAYLPSAPVMQDDSATLSAFALDRGGQRELPAGWARQRDARTPLAPHAAPYPASSLWRLVGVSDDRAPATTAPVNGWAWRSSR
jgi:hypothetical protein